MVRASPLMILWFIIVMKKSRNICDSSFSRRSNSLYPISPGHLAMGSVEKVNSCTELLNLTSTSIDISKVSRSSSLTTTTLKDSAIPMDTLKLPDARFFLFFSHCSYLPTSTTTTSFSLFKLRMSAIFHQFQIKYFSRFSNQKYFPPQTIELCLRWFCCVLGFLSLR